MILRRRDLDFLHGRWCGGSLAIATTIMCLNLVFQFAALLVATDASYVTAFGATVSSFLVIAPTIAEIWMVGYLLVKGVKVPAQGTPALRAGKTGPVLGEALP